MIHFFRKLFRGILGAGGVPAAAPAPAPVAAPARAPEVPEPHAFDSVWERLTTGNGPAADLEPEAQAQVETLVPMVLEHFSRNRPDPASFPALAMQIMKLVQEPELDMNELIRTISPDPAISLHVLRAANSALFSLGAEIQDLRRAVMQLGTREVGDIAAGVASRSLFDLSLKAEFELFGQRWHTQFLDAMAVAFGASQFAFDQKVGRADHAFLAGMFHDIGKTLALRSLAALVLDGQVAGPLPDPVVDTVLERVHVEIGCDLLRLWGLPEYLTVICQHHHDPEVASGLEHLDIHILRLVEGLHRLVLDPTDACRLDETRQSLQAMGLVRRHVQRVWADMAVQTERVRVLFPA